MTNIIPNNLPIHCANCNYCLSLESHIKNKIYNTYSYVCKFGCSDFIYDVNKSITCDIFIGMDHNTVICLHKPMHPGYTLDVYSKEHLNHVNLEEYVYIRDQNFLFTCIENNLPIKYKAIEISYSMLTKQNKLKIDANYNSFAKFKEDLSFIYQKVNELLRIEKLQSFK